ncbi:MAG: site-specific DNA-methyltransferase, partial [Oscillospiraceae bacterium]|nr:site-specific DNA-methyltransferase [Oscillospiraceae bacterium]
LLANAPISATLRPCREESVDFDTTQNLYIEGDNLEALRHLQKTHTGKIKAVIIDPPYNTGGDFVYRDRFRTAAGCSDDATRMHADWCSMMYSRLLLTKPLLTEDGALFICIGEQEVHTLMCLCDEIFGPQNRITLFSRVTKRSSNNGGHFSPCIDYILMYARSVEKLPPYSVDLPEEIVSRYKKTDQYLPERGPYQEVSLYMSALKHGGSHYPIACPDGSFACPPNGMPWRWNEATFRKGLAEGRIVFKASRRSPLVQPGTNARSGWNIYTKMYLHERTSEGLQPKNYSEAFQNTLATYELRRLEIPFDFAKPVSLISYLLRLQTTDEDVVLDYFSGSATTAHAVMQCNAQDGGRRRFIMVQIPEPTSPSSKAARAGFTDISAIGKERIRRAGRQLREQYPDAVFDAGFLLMKLGGEADGM